MSSDHNFDTKTLQSQQSIDIEMLQLSSKKDIENKSKNVGKYIKNTNKAARKQKSIDLNRVFFLISNLSMIYLILFIT